MERKDKSHAFKAAPLGIHEQKSYLARLVSSQRFIAIIALAFLVLLAFPLARSYSRKMVVEKEIADMQAQIAEFEKENEEMKEFLTYLSSEQSAEEQARLNLNLKKPGEAVVIVETAKDNEDSQGENAETESSSGWEKWWNYFFK